MSYSFKGGEKLSAKLSEMRNKLKAASKLRVGFLEDAQPEPDGAPVAYIAIIQEYGATINAAARTQIIYRKPRKARKGKNGFRFVKASRKGAVAKEVDVGPHTIVIPARPFFRAMIQQNKGAWGPMLAQMLKAKKFDAEAALKMLGRKMEEQLQDSIEAFADPPNAKSTIRKKKFNSPLMDTGHMRNSVGSDVS